MDRALNRRVVLFVTVALMLGIFVGGLTTDNVILMAVIPSALFAVGIIFLLGFKKALVCAVYVAMCVGCLVYYLDYYVSYDGDVDGGVNVSARVESVTDGYAIVGDLSFDGKSYQGKARLYYDGELNVGEKLTFVAEAETNGRDIFSSYDMSAYNDRVYYVLNATEVEATQGKLKFFEKVKKRITDPMFRFMDGDDAGIAASLLLGDKSALSYSDSEVIRGIGMSHVFAVSGLHVGFMTAIVIFILKKLKAKPVTSLVVTAVVLLIYGILTGFPSGIKRAAVMSMIYMAAPLFKRKSDPITALSAACFLIVLTNPRELFDIGFIMSASAVAGIILFYTPIYHALLGRSHNAFRKGVSASVAVTVSANILLLPVCFNVFNTFAVYMILSNLIILPLVTVSYAMVAVAACFTAVFPVMGFLYYPSQFPIICIRLLANLIFSLPHATVTVGSMGAATACYVAAAFFVSRLNKLSAKVKLAGLSVCSVTGLILLLVI